MLWNINQLLCSSLVALIIDSFENLNTEQSFWFLHRTKKKKKQFCERSAGVTYGVVKQSRFDFLLDPGAILEVHQVI